MKSPDETSPGVPKNADELITNITKLMAEAEEMLSESTSQHAEENAEMLRVRHEAAAQCLAARYATVKAKLSAMVSTTARRTDEAIRTYPYESAAVALGMGLLIGACCFRRSE